MVEKVTAYLPKPRKVSKERKKCIYELPESGAKLL